MISFRSSLNVALVSGALALAGPLAHASGGDAVALGEVSSTVERRDVDLRALLRTSAEEELRALDLRGIPATRRSILSVSLVKMETAQEAAPAGNKTVTTCIVSATLRDARRGAIFAVLEGRARGESDAGGTGTGMFVRTAVRGAVARIPEALKR